MKFLNVFFLAFDFFRFRPSIICKNIMKTLHNNDMVEVQTWDTKKQYNVTTILALCNVLSSHPSIPNNVNIFQKN